MREFTVLSYYDISIIYIWDKDYWQSFLRDFRHIRYKSIVNTYTKKYIV